MKWRWLVLSLCGVLLAGACGGGEEDVLLSGDPPVAESATTAPVDEPTTTTTSTPRGDAVAAPIVEGPVTGGDRGGLPANPAPREILEEYDYVEEEYFLSGEATAYTPAGELGRDGRWKVEPAGTAPFATRILVRRPADPNSANGVVAVEWFNVSGGQDADPDFGFLYPELLARGTTWVGVTAQASGIEGPGLTIDIPGVSPIPLKTADPTRYEPLDHPGDDYSYDIYSQAAQAIRRPEGVDPLGGVSADRVIAIGESQSAGRLTSYINAVHPEADIYDAFLVHSRFSAAPIAADGEQPEVVNFRTDLTEPILWFQTETDVARAFLARQPDTDRLVTWELAGAAHADQSQLDYGGASIRVIEPDLPVPDFEELCGGPLNDGPQPLVLRRAWADLVRWVVDGVPPAPAPELEIDGDTIARDELGIALGGIRTPDVDVPIAVHTGAPRPDASVICSLFGSTTPLDADELAARYATNEDYVEQVRSSAEAGLQAGYLLPEGVEQFVAEAEAAPVPN